MDTQSYNKWALLPSRQPNSSAPRCTMPPLGARRMPLFGLCRNKWKGYIPIDEQHVYPQVYSPLVSKKRCSALRQAHCVKPSTAQCKPLVIATGTRRISLAKANPPVPL